MTYDSVQQKVDTNLWVTFWVTYAGMILVERVCALFYGSAGLQWQYKRLFVLVWLIKFDGNNQVYSKVLRPALERYAHAFPAGEHHSAAVAGESDRQAQERDKQNEILDYIAQLFTHEDKQHKE